MLSMTDVLPVLIVGSYQNLIVQAIGRHGYGRHVGWKLKHRGQPGDGDEAQAEGQGSGKLEVTMAGDYESPFAERRDIHVIRIGLQARLLERLRDAPVRIA